MEMTSICGILPTFASERLSGHFADFERLEITHKHAG